MKGSCGRVWMGASSFSRRVAYRRLRPNHRPLSSPREERPATVKITKHAVLLLGVGLALTACGSSDQPSADVALPSPASTSTTDEELVPNACGDETYRADHAEYCANVDPLPEGDADLPDTNDRGNVEAALGQEIPLPDGGTIVVDAASPVTLPCPEDTEYSESVPSNGTFVRLDLRAATAPASAEVINQPSVSSSNFK